MIEDHTPWVEVTGGYAKDMSLRDYFAAKAMPISWGMYEKLYDCSADAVIPLVADYAYDLADAMLKRREA